ncbi:hypothetical protein SELMODRAFT_432504 [Selaginella moellendorffii]|uniref:Pentacotripeptide-repeat region of PRORP domain-containing protein n=1 Tax=Selaginella moellendorffii TaxID=88036 RepID=D8TG73_SELML|nr:hypothetical protein SELMODRAFT_432504 [Selaginella moellendorffii]
MENARLMLDETLANDVVPSERIYTAFTEGYARTGDVEKAFGVFQRAIDVVAYGALLKACCNSGAMHGAAEVFQQITDAGLKHNQITYCTMLDGWAKQTICKSMVFILIQSATRPLSRLVS